MEEVNFQFTQQMVGGTITIPDVYKVDVIEIPSRTENNIIQNPSGGLHEYPETQEFKTMRLELRQALKL